jgi:hypothetical protein
MSLSDADIGIAYTSVVAIDSAGLHELSEALAEGRKVPHAIDRIKRIKKILELTRWPEDLASKSLELKTVVTDMTNAFDEESEEKIKELAPQFHASYHRLCNSFYDWLLAHNSQRS